MSKVAVFGAGSWGTAFSIVLADAGNDVAMWARREELCRGDQRPAREPRLPARRRAAAGGLGHPRRREGAARRRHRRASRRPRRRLRDEPRRLGAVPRRGRGAGVADEGRRARHPQADERGDRARSPAPARSGSPSLSGPNLAKEIARREPAASVVACADEDVAKHAAGPLPLAGVPPLHVNVDVLGCELGGAYKNVVALAVGMAVGLGFGDNTTASVITRGLAETARLAMALGADPLTLMGLAGLGDLVATCSSPLSRNRTFGEKLGQGMSTEEIVRLHPAGRRGRQVLRVAARARRAHRRRDARSSSTSTRRRRPR